MPAPLVAAAGISLLGSGINALFGANTASKNLKAQREQQQYVRGQAAKNAQQINQQFSGLSQLLQSLSGAPVEQQQANPERIQFDPITGMSIGASGVDTDALFSGAGSKGFNVGQDALMQFLRADPTGKMQGANGVLQEIAQTGLPSNLTPIFEQAANVNRDNNAELLASLTGQSRSLGQRFGSATQRIEADTARRLANEQSLQNSQLALQAGEAAAGRRLNAASTLGGFQLQGAGQLLNAGQAQTQTLLQALLANAGNQQQADTFNANTAFNTAQFNANSGMQATQNNNAQMLQAIFGNNQSNIAARGLQQQGLSQAAGIAGQQGSLLNQLLALQAGQPAPQGSPAGGMAIGSAFNDLASILTAYNQYGSGNRIPSVPNVYIPPVDIGRIG